MEDGIGTVEGQTRRWALPALVYGAILVVSSVPGDRFDPIGLAGWVSYVGHGFEYAALGAALRWAAAGLQRPLAVTVMVGAAGGALDELWQSSVPGRHTSLVDLAVDVGAVLLAGVVAGRVLGSRPAREG